MPLRKDKWSETTETIYPPNANPSIIDDKWGSPVGGRRPSFTFTSRQNQQGGAPSSVLDSYVEQFGFPFFSSTIYPTTLKLGRIASGENWSNTSGEEPWVSVTFDDESTVRAYLRVASPLYTAPDPPVTPEEGETKEESDYDEGAYNFSTADSKTLQPGYPVLCILDQYKNQWYLAQTIPQGGGGFTRLEIGQVTAGISFDSLGTSPVSSYVFTIPRTGETGITVTHLVSGGTPRATGATPDWRNFYPHFPVGDYAYLGLSDHGGTERWYILETFQDLRGIVHRAEVTAVDGDDDYFSAKLLNTGGTKVGDTLTVYCDLRDGATQLNQCYPTILGPDGETPGDKVDIYYSADGQWRCLGPFWRNGFSWSAALTANSQDRTGTTLEAIILDKEGGETGDSITVDCTIAGSNNTLDKCEPALLEDEIIEVYLDQEGNWRTPVIFTPVDNKGVIYFALTQEAAQSDAYLSVKLLDSSGNVTGSAFDVTCVFQDGATSADECTPQIQSGKKVKIVKGQDGVWYLAETLTYVGDECEE